MVKPLTLAFVGFLTLAPVAFAHSVKVECNRPQVFEGETLGCQFVLFSKEEIVEIEVVKFPEFRGFWKENLVLKQGPVALVPADRTGTLFRAVIAGYLLTPVIGAKERAIEPIKINAKSARFWNDKDSGEAGEMIQSDPFSMTVHTLPPPSPADKPFFHGAVGNFRLQPEQRDFYFKPNEPVLLRLALVGRGNFSEIIELPLSISENVEVLNQRTHSQVNQSTGTKWFEWALSAKSRSPFTLALPPLVFFDPELKKYQRQELPEVAFHFLTAGTEQKADSKSHLPLIATAWRTESPWARWGWILFFGVPIVFTLILGGIVTLKSTLRRRRESVRYRRRHAWKRAEKSYRAGQHEAFLQQAEVLMTEILRDKLEKPLPAGASRAILLREARPFLPDEIRQSSDIVFASRDTLYSGDSVEPALVEKTYRALQSVLNKP